MARDHLSLSGGGLPEAVRRLGDTDVLLSAACRYASDDLSELLEGVTVLTDQRIWFGADAGSLEPAAELSDVLEVSQWECGWLRAELSDGDLLLSPAAPSSTAEWLAAFCDVLPLEPVQGTPDEFVAEKRPCAALCRCFGVAEAAGKTEDPVAALERERKERLEQQRAAQEAGERERAAEKAELRKRVEGDKDEATRQYAAAMRRLSVKRRAASVVRRHLRAGGVDERPAWWDGEWQPGVDPFTLDEDRVLRLAAAADESAQSAAPTAPQSAKPTPPTAPPAPAATPAPAPAPEPASKPAPVRREAARRPPPPSYQCRHCEMCGSHWAADCPTKDGVSGPTPARPPRPAAAVPEALREAMAAAADRKQQEDQALKHRIAALARGGRRGAPVVPGAESRPAADPKTVWNDWDVHVERSPSGSPTIRASPPPTASDEIVPPVADPQPEAADPGRWPEGEALEASEGKRRAVCTTAEVAVRAALTESEEAARADAVAREARSAAEETRLHEERILATAHAEESARHALAGAEDTARGDAHRDCRRWLKDAQDTRSLRDLSAVEDSRRAGVVAEEADFRVSTHGACRLSALEGAEAGGRRTTAEAEDAVRAAVVGRARESRPTKSSGLVQEVEAGVSVVSASTPSTPMPSGALDLEGVAQLEAAERAAVASAWSSGLSARHSFLQKAVAASPQRATIPGRTPAERELLRRLHERERAARRAGDHQELARLARVLEAFDAAASATADTDVGRQEPPRGASALAASAAEAWHAELLTAEGAGDASAVSHIAARASDWLARISRYETACSNIADRLLALRTAVASSTDAEMRRAAERGRRRLDAWHARRGRQPGKGTDGLAVQARRAENEPEARADLEWARAGADAGVAWHQDVWASTGPRTALQHAQQAESATGTRHNTAQ
eukprot:TRINITY_DN3427_c0_g1_i5.p1 TRINITY_DN3427_c0_g1~~TRINITY_DN3427_c0_g1_i5.p1  ORF type:complete len:915 (+),score=224.54 TRINITY_DN3427_c0_g1_i5:41-2785(+)